MYNHKQLEIIKTYIKIVNKRKRHLSRHELSTEGYSKDTIQYHFGSHSNLKEECKKYDPKAFSCIIEGELFSPKIYGELVEKIKQYKKFIITTAVTGCTVDNNFYNCIKNYCKINNALLLILPSSDPAKSNDKKFIIDPFLYEKNDCIIFSDVSLNSNLFISSIKLSAKHIDPITGLSRIGQRDGSFIYASPKQRMTPIPTSNTKYPHVIMTTGAITEPDYATRRYMSERTAYIAEHDHVLGAIIVEVENNKRFYFRQVQANSDGSFIDLGIKYNKNNTEKANPKAFVLGDWHSGETDPLVKNNWFDVIKSLKPEFVVLHDLFTGTSINPYDIGKNITLAQKAINNKLSLENELINVAKDLDELNKICNNIIIVKSNHDEFLERYLQTGRYVNDPMNHLISLKLATALISGNNPLQWFIEDYYKIQQFKKITWLKRDQDYKVANIQLSAHGDLGPNGCKGSIKNMEIAYGACVTGHSHSPQILRHAWSVGTSTHLKLDYNRGPSSWLQCSCLIYNNGSRQLINSIDGKWKS